MTKTSVLFLCTGNSCRSQMAEALLRGRHGNRFEVYSSGSAPDLSKFPDSSGVHPLALRILRKNGISTEGLHAKLWDDFISGKTPVDIVLTLCGSALGELAVACPVYPGGAVSAHWGVDDPSHAKGTDAEVEAAFESALNTIRRRIDALAALPLDRLSRGELKVQLQQIGSL